MKGVSTVIATLLMLIITVAISITAYSYIKDIFSSQTGGLIELVEVECNAKDNFFYATFRNLDQVQNVLAHKILMRVDGDPVPDSDIKWRDSSGSFVTLSSNNSTFLKAGNVNTVAKVSHSSLTSGKGYRLKIIGPSGKPSQMSVFC